MEFKRRKSSLNSRSMLGYLQKNHKLDRFVQAVSPDTVKPEKSPKNLSGWNKLKFCANKILLQSVKKEKAKELSPPIHMRSGKRHCSFREHKENCIEKYINKVINELELDKLQSYESFESKGTNIFDKYLGPNGDKEEEILSRTVKTFDQDK
ncbi:unnamed protein product [Blepharisma stoltei]|uniref:Uncharacterized protein n=1 Tax=Blepharisma stoltei TaxID=1481888 RepID=A0AAU9IZY1_9CILI|nr:unnamed protein product [Blepharisma stoltei]